MSQGLASFGKETPTGPVMLRRLLHEVKEFLIFLSSAVDIHFPIIGIGVEINVKR